MSERFKKIAAGLLIIVCSLAGMWEYMQLYMYFDLPQAVVILPVAGFVAGIALRKAGFLVPAVAAVTSVVYQMVESRSSSIGIVETSKFNIILNLLPVILLLMLLGVAGGLLVRVLLERKKPLVVGIVCGVLGLVLSFGGGIFLFQNPLYPFLAKNAIQKYAEKYNSADYPVSEVSVVYSFDDLEYEGRVVMSDGRVYALYHDRSTGEVSEIQQ